MAPHDGRGEGAKPRPESGGGPFDGGPLQPLGEGENDRRERRAEPRGEERPGSRARGGEHGQDEDRARGDGERRLAPPPGQEGEGQHPEGGERRPRGEEVILPREGHAAPRPRALRG